MIKPVSFLVATLASGLLSFSQVKVPDVVKNAFNAKFPGATSVTWGKGNTKEYEAEFILKNAAVAANFKEDGSWVITETTVPSTELPPTIKNTVTGKYHGSSIISAAKVEKPATRMYYEIVIMNAGKRQVLNMHENGSFL